MRMSRAMISIFILVAACLQQMHRYEMTPQSDTIETSALEFEHTADEYSQHDVQPYNAKPDIDGFTYISETCKPFYRCKREIEPSGKQFAFLTFGRCNSTGKNRYNPRFPETLDQCHALTKLPHHNYAFAVPSTKEGWRVSAVDQIVSHLPEMKQWVSMRIIPEPLDVYVFAYLSPCRECTRKISDIEDSTVHVTWIDQYQGESASTFFKNLETMFEKPNINVLWKVDNPCLRPTSYQYELYKCLIEKTSKVADCSNINQDVAKFINKLIYACVDHFPSNNMTACKDHFVSKFAPKADGSFKYHLMSCMQNLLIHTLGPPLSPEDPTWGSQNVTDLKGEYPDFCFQK